MIEIMIFHELVMLEWSLRTALLVHVLMWRAFYRIDLLMAANLAPCLGKAMVTWETVGSDGWDMLGYMWETQLCHSSGNFFSTRNASSVSWWQSWLGLDSKHAASASICLRANAKLDISYISPQIEVDDAFLPCWYQWALQQWQHSRWQRQRGG